MNEKARTVILDFATVFDIVWAIENSSLKIQTIIEKYKKDANHPKPQQFECLWH